MAAHEQRLSIPLTNCSCSSGEWKHTHCSISSSMLSLSGSTKPIWPGGCLKIQKTALKHFYRWSIHNHHPAPGPWCSSQDLVYLQARENERSAILTRVCSCHPCERGEWVWGRMTLSFLLHQQEACATEHRAEQLKGFPVFPSSKSSSVPADC